MASRAVDLRSFGAVLDRDHREKVPVEALDVAGGLSHQGFLHPAASIVRHDIVKLRLHARARDKGGL